MQRKSLSSVLMAHLLMSGVAGAAVVSVPELPQFEMARAPIQPPASVSAGAHVNGLFVARAPMPSPKFRQLQIFRSASEAANFSKRGNLDRDASEAPQPCTYLADDPSAFGQPWPALAMSTISHFQGSERPAVVGLHVETLEGEWTKERGGSLGIVDGWLDVRSRGLKVIEQKTMPVKQVAEGPFGVRVFAARGTDAVHFVVLPPTLATGVSEFMSSFERAVLQSGGEGGPTDCRHVRVTLEATRGEGARATVSFPHLQPIVGDPVDGEEPETERPTTTTFQVLQVHLSASKNATGAAPVVSVGFRVDAPQIIE